MADTKELVGRLRKASRAIYLATEETVADDISSKLTRAADTIESLERERDEARKSWRCFHCDEVFVSEQEARLHFGRDESKEPGCCIKVGAERGLLKAMRRAEDDAAEAWFRLQNESGEAAKAYYAQNSRHQEQLRVAEEAGYERGLRDAAHEATRAEATESELTTLRTRVAKMEEALRAIDAKVVELGLAAQRKANGHKHEKFAAVRHSMRLIVSAALTEEQP